MEIPKETEHGHKYRKQNGETPAYRALQEVRITRDFSPETREKLLKFIGGLIDNFIAPIIYSLQI